MDRENRDELDLIIDRGLAGYAAYEPLAGLEGRVLNRVRLANAGRRRLSWHVWAAALPVLAAIILLVVASRSSRAPAAPPKANQVAHTEAPSPAPPPAVTRATIARRVVRHGRPLPKKDQFPTPTPITPEERALIAIAEFRPLEKSSEEIQIAPIEIPPLEIDGSR